MDKISAQDAPPIAANDLDGVIGLRDTDIAAFLPVKQQNLQRQSCR